MAENLNTLYYALELDDVKMQQQLQEAIENLSNLDKEFDKINKTIEDTFKKNHGQFPVQKEIKSLRAELQGMEKDWNNLTLAEKRGTKGQDLRAKYEALRKEAGNLNNSLAKLYSESQKAASGQKGLAAQLGLVNNQLTLQNRIASNINTLFTTSVSIFAAKSLIQNLAQVRGEFENQQIALRAILRDAEAADKIFGQIKSFAVVSPFEFKDLVGYAKQLSAFQVPVDELFETTKRLADVSAGLGVGMDRIILAYGQVRSAAVLRGQELRQFTEAGIPLVDELAKKFSELEGRVVSAGDVFEKISNRMVSFEMVKEIFEDMTNEGGMFYMMQEKQAESLKGKIANLADAYDIMLNDIGEANNGILKGGVAGIAALFENWEKVWSVLKTLIAGYGAYKTAIILATVAEKAHIAANLSGNLVLTAKNLGIVISNLGRFQAALRLTGMTAKSFNAALGGVVGILTLIGVGIYEVIQNSNRLNNELNKISSNEFSAFKQMSDSLENLANKLKNTVQGSQEHREIIRQINNAYGEYLPFILDEKTALDAVANSTEQVIEAMKKRKMMMAQEKGEQAIESAYGDNLVKTRKETINFLDRLNVAKEDAINIVRILEEKIKQSSGTANIEELYDEIKKYLGEDIFKDSAYSLADLDLRLKYLSKTITNIQKAEKELADQNNITFGTSFNTQQARLEFEKLEASYAKMRDELRKKPLDKIDFQKELDKINLSEQMAKIDFKVEYEGMSKENAEKLKYQLIHQFSLTIEDVNKQLEKITSKEEFDFIRIKDPKKNLDEIKSETISSYKSTLESLESLQATQKSLNKLEGIDEKNIKARQEEIERIQKKLELYKQLAKILGIEEQLDKKRGSTKDPRVTALENEIKLIQEAEKAYEKLTRYFSAEKAGQNLSGIFPTVDFSLNEKGEADFSSQIQAIINKIIPLNREAGEKAQEAFNKGVRDKKSDALVDNVKDALDAITKEIDLYKSKYDLYNQLLNLGENEEKAINIAFGVNFEGEVDIVKYLQDKIKETVGKDIKIDLGTDIISKDFEDVFQGIDIPEERKKKLQDFFNLLKKQFIDFQTEASKAKQSLADMITDLENKDFNLFGKGFELDISKIARDTSNAYAEIDAREREKTEELAKFKDAKEKELYEAQLKRLRILGEKEKESIRKQSQEKLNDLAGKVINEGLDEKGLKGIFDNLSEATFKQLNQLKRYFKEVSDNGIVISTEEAETSLNKVGLSIDQLKDKSMDEIVLELDDTSLSDTEKKAISLYMQLKKAGVNAELLANNLKKISREKFTKVIDQELVKIIDSAKQAAAGLNTLGDALYDLGESGGNESLMNIGDTLSSISVLVDSAADIVGGVLSGNPADVIKGVFSIATAFIEAEARHQKALAELAKAKIAQQREYNLLLLEQNLLFKEGSNIFNTDQIGKAINAIGVYKDAISELAKEMQGEASKPKMNLFEMWTGDVTGSFQKKVDAYNKGLSALYNARIVTGHEKTGLFGWGKGRDTYSSVLDVYDDLVTAEGKLNVTRAQSILDTEKMDDETRNLLETLIQLQNQAEEAYKEMQAVLQETFGALGDNLSDSIVNAFVSGTDAAESFKASVESILEDLARQMMYKLFLQKNFDKLQENLEDIYSNAENTDEGTKKLGEQVTNLLGNFFSGIGDTIDQSTQFLEEFQKQAAASGFNIFQGEKGEGLKEGIKGITEDTAQLLASYMNAVRGSVLLQELYMKNIDANVAGIYQAMGGNPNITTTTTLPPEIIAAISEPMKLNNSLLANIDMNMTNVHSIAANALAQLVLIQANTYNTATATREAVEQLKSVIAPGHPQGGSGIKIW